MPVLAADTPSLKNINKISKKYKQIIPYIVVLLNYIDKMTVRHAVGNNGGEEYDIQRIFAKLLYRRRLLQRDTICYPTLWKKGSRYRRKDCYGKG